MQEVTIHQLAGQKRLEDIYKDLDMLPKDNKAEMTGMINAVEENLRLHHGVVRAPFVYVIRKMMIAQTYSEYLRYVTLDDEMISRMSHLFPNKNRLKLKNSNTIV